MISLFIRFMTKTNLIEVNKDNISDHPARCILKSDNIGYKTKLDWLKKRFSEGLIIKQLYDEKNKLIGFIEYIPGEFAWRAVDAKGYMFIHCIWIYPNSNKKKGYGSLLINECIKDAEKNNMLGVAVVTSEGSFMAGKNIFLKNGFKSISSAKPSYDLLVKTLKNGSNTPKFKDWEKQLEKYNGLNIVYSDQCPWVSRSMFELPNIAKKKGLDLNIVKLKNAEDAQNAPSVYSCFNIIYNGNLLADHYISARRFENILNKELK